MRKVGIIASVFLVATAIGGCEKAAPPKDTAASTNQAVEQPGAVKETVGTMLQYDTLKAGRRTQDRASRAVSAHNERVKEPSPEEQ